MRVFFCQHPGRPAPCAQLVHTLHPQCNTRRVGDPPPTRSDHIAWMHDNRGVAWSQSTEREVAIEVQTKQAEQELKSKQMGLNVDASNLDNRVLELSQQELSDRRLVRALALRVSNVRDSHQLGIPEVDSIEKRSVAVNMQMCDMSNEHCTVSFVRIHCFF